MAKIDDTSFRVKLEGINDTVIFNTMPNFTESVTAKYEETTLTHSIGTIHSYVNSPGRTFGLNDIKLVSRNSAEARRNLQNLLILKSWTKSYFGIMDEQTQNWLGAPPEVVYFSAYASSTSRGNFYRIPVVIMAVDTQYNNDIDYSISDDIREILPKKYIDLEVAIKCLGGKLSYIKSGSTGHTFKGIHLINNNSIEDPDKEPYAIKIVAYPRKENYGDMYNTKRPENTELLIITL
jgi:hypothetical protein